MTTTADSITAPRQGYMALPDLGSNEAGAIVYWRLAGSVDYEDLENAWRDAGLDDKLLPAPTTRPTALKRAMQTFKEPGVMVRKLKGEEVGFILVNETYADGRPEYSRGMEVTLDSSGSLAMAPHDDKLFASVQATFAHHLNYLSQHDISSWLVDLARRARAVRLRDTGGIYFVPKTSIALWRAFTGALRGASRNALFEIPALHCDEAVAAILDAITAEADEACEAFTAELDAKLDDMTAYSVRVRKARVEELRAKIASYEELLGVKMPALTDQVQNIEAPLADAALRADG